MKRSTISAFDDWAQSAGEILTSLLEGEVLVEESTEVGPLDDNQWEEINSGGFVYSAYLSEAPSASLLLVLEEEPACRLASELLREDDIPLSLKELHRDILAEALGKLCAQLPTVFGLSQDIDETGGGELTDRLNGLDPKSYDGFKFCFATEMGQVPLYLLTTSEALSDKAPVMVKRGPGTSANLQQAAFQKFETPKRESGDRDLDLILDVPMKVTAVLGTTSVSMEELISLGQGSVLELDKLAGEPVELFVHGRQVAVGEVVVIDERFGVKIISLARGRSQNGAYVPRRTTRMSTAT